jgi:hypothetical protein
MLIMKDVAMNELEEKYRESEPVAAQPKSHIECRKIANALFKTRNDVASKMDKMSTRQNKGES